MLEVVFMSFIFKNQMIIKQDLNILFILPQEAALQGRPKIQSFPQQWKGKLPVLRAPNAHKFQETWYMQTGQTDSLKHYNDKTLIWYIFGGTNNLSSQNQKF